MSIQRKTVTWGRLGWKRVCKNTMRFGWDSESNVEHTETTYTTSYEGEVVNDKVYLHENTKESTKTTMYMYFTRNTDQFVNLPQIFVLELLYNILLFIHKIVKFLIPLIVAGFFILLLTPFKDILYNNMEITAAIFGVFVAWGILIILENILARIACKILKVRAVN